MRSLRRLQQIISTTLSRLASYNDLSSGNTLRVFTTNLRADIGEYQSSDTDINNSETSAPAYFNFSTRNEFLRRHGILNARGGRRVRVRGGGVAEEEQLLRNMSLENGPADPHNAGPPIFRREIALCGAPQKLGGSIAVSVDVPSKRFLDMFCDYEARRCKLCNESFVQWHLHACGIPHSGREGILLELVRPFCGTPEEQVRRWNQRLYESTAFGRIPALSHPNNQERKRKLKYLLMYLKDREVLRDVFKLSNDGSDAARTFEFERLEFVGDGVAKYILSNIHNILFPVSEGGIRGRLANFQFVMDGNEGLARGYDYLELQDLTLSSRVVSKFKSDVVETLFGELQFYLWATQLDINTDPLTFPFTKDMYTLRAIVQHVMYETATVLFMYHVEFILGMLQRVAREEQLQYVRADPSLRSMQSRSAESHRHTRSAADDDEDGAFGDDGHYGGRNSGGSLVISSPTTKLMKTRVARRHLHGGSAETFLESTNYGNYKRVVPIGGLLPRPFTREQLRPIPNYMPHVQRDEAMTQQMRDAAASWSAQLNKELMGEAAQPASTLKDESSLIRADTEAVAAYSLSATPTAKKKLTREPLSVPRLKDEELIAELL